MTFLTWRRSTPCVCELMEEETDLAASFMIRWRLPRGWCATGTCAWTRTCPATLPLMFVDTTRVRQVLLNLLSNACRFTEHGRIVVNAAVENGNVHVSVADTGIGMTPQQVKPHVPRVPAGRRLTAAALRRHGTGAGDQQTLCSASWRAHLGGQRDRRWHHRPFHAAIVESTVFDEHHALMLGRATVVETVTRRKKPKLSFCRAVLPSGLRLLGRYVSGYHFLPSSQLSSKPCSSSAAIIPGRSIVASEAPPTPMMWQTRIHAARCSDGRARRLLFHRLE